MAKQTEINKRKPITTEFPSLYTYLGDLVKRSLTSNSDSIIKDIITSSSTSSLRVVWSFDGISKPRLVQIPNSGFIL